MAHAKVEEQIARVEFVWENPTDEKSPVDLVFFPKPKVWTSLSQKSKNQLIEEIDVLNGEDGKKREFLERAKLMVDEMEWLYLLNKNPIIGAIGTLFVTMRWYGFYLVVLLNVVYAVSVEGPGNQGRYSANDDFGLGDYKGPLVLGKKPTQSLGDDDEAPDMYTLRVHGGFDYGAKLTSHGLILIFTILVIFFYALPFAYLMISRTKLVKSKHTGMLGDYLAKLKLESLKASDARLNPAFPFANVIIFKMFGYMPCPVGLNYDDMIMFRLLGQKCYFPINKFWYTAFFGPFTPWGATSPGPSAFGGWCLQTFLYACLGFIFYIQYWDYHDYEKCDPDADDADDGC